MISSLSLRSLTVVFIVIGFCSCHTQTKETDLTEGLVGYWQLSGDIKDASGNELHPIMHGKVEFNAEDRGGAKLTAAAFDGRDGWLEVPPNPKIQLGSGDFSVAAWIYTDSVSDDMMGDIISQYDPSARRGFRLSLKYNLGPTNTGNFRQLDFGIDDNHSSPWVDYGRPGNTIYPFSLVSYKGSLYASTCDSSADGHGHVYRYSGDRWVDCGFLDSSNAVTSLTAFNGELYASTGHYRTGGSSLPSSKNTIEGGRVFRYEAPDKWMDCGRVPVEAIAGMIVYNGSLYATSNYNSPGFYRYEGGKEWVKCDVPDKRLNAMGIYDGYIYATSYDWGHVYRYDGTSWTDCGQVGDEKINTQCYAFAAYEGKLYVSTWASGRVYRFDGVNQWTDVGRLGQELEVMGLIVHNGRLLGGTLPLAEVYSYEGDTTWQRMDQLDRTPDVKYRRAWTMAEHDGKVFCSTLPSGKVYGFEAGKSVMSPNEVPAGWQHVAAVKTADRLRLFVNGKLVNETTIPDTMQFNFNSESPLKIGFGSNDYFNGRMREVRLYGRALKNDEIVVLSQK